MALPSSGATEDPTKLGGRRYRSLIEDGFSGPIYPVHPKAASVRGVPAYRTVRDVPDPVDLAVVVVPTRGGRGHRGAEEGHCSMGTAVKRPSTVTPRRRYWCASGRCSRMCPR